MNLDETFAGREILRVLETKYGTKDEKVLLSLVVMDHLTEIFTREEIDFMSRRVSRVPMHLIFGGRDEHET